MYAKKLQQRLKDKKTFHTVVIRSTVSPGTLQNCAQIMEEISGKKTTKTSDLQTILSFCVKGAAIHDYFNPPYIIIGSYCKNQLTS